MSLRQGVTAAEEAKLKNLAAKGTKWAEIVERCQTKDDRGNDQVPLLADVDMKAVKPMYEHLLKLQDAAVKAGHTDILTHERVKAAAKAKALAEKKAAADDK